MLMCDRLSIECCGGLQEIRVIDGGPNHPLSANVGAIGRLSEQPMLLNGLWRYSKGFLRVKWRKKWTRQHSSLIDVLAQDLNGCNIE